MNTIAIVFSRPIWSDIQPKVGRANPFKTLSTMPATTSVVPAMKNRSTCAPAIL